MDLKKWDFVEVIHFNREESKEEEMKQFIGAKGIIVEIFGKESYRNEIVFFDMELQKKSMDDGGILWRNEDLEILEIEI